MQKLCVCVCVRVRGCGERSRGGGGSGGVGGEEGQVRGALVCTLCPRVRAVVAAGQEGAPNAGVKR